MSDTFNGYHVWLGIPPDEQPPNHYRLLGITAFETDLDVIEHAADRQMAHVRTFQAGRNAGLSQQILNELAAARLTLLNPEKKSAYDSQLRGKLTPKKGAGVPVGKAVPVAKAVPLAKPLPKPEPDLLGDPGDEIGVDLDTFPSSGSSSAPAFSFPVKRRKYKQQSAGKNAAMLGALMAIAVVSILVLFFFVWPFLQSSDFWNAIQGTSSTTGPSDPGGPASSPTPK